MVIYPESLTEQLDFPFILQELEKLCYGKQARQMAGSLQPSSEEEEVRKRLLETSEFLQSFGQEHSVPLQGYAETEKELQLLGVSGSVLTAPQWHLIRQMLGSARELLLFLADKALILPTLSAAAAHLSPDKELQDAISAVINPEGVVRDDASDELRQVRKELQDNRRESERLYRAHIQRLRKLGQLADFEESYVNGRRVLGILAEHKREFKGIVLGQSASGRIAFMEPQNLIELNNLKLHWEESERREIHRILRELSDSLRPYVQQMSHYAALLSHFDFVGARARLARRMKACMPQLSANSEQQTIRLQQAFHPVLLLRHQPGEPPIVPITCSFTEEQRIMVISGPNAGGKSITLKTVGLLQLMLQCGLLLPASPQSEFSIKTRLFGDIGDNQSIEDGLSTYSSRLIKMKHFLQHCDRKTLFLIDEFGTGSDPDMGGALAETILDRLNERGSTGVVTTHFTNLKLLATHKQGIFNACMLFNSRSLKPLYQLQIGEPGSSFTFEVAEKIGLPEEILSEARQKLSREKIRMDELLNQLQAEKNTLIRLRRDLQKQMSKTTAEKREFQSLSDRLEQVLEQQHAQREERQRLMDMGRKLHQLTLEWTEGRDKKSVIGKFVKLAGFEQARKKEKEAEEKTLAWKQKKLEQVRTRIRVGSKVRMLKSRETGEVQALRGDRAIVLFGRVEMNIGLEKLEPV